MAAYEKHPAINWVPEEEQPPEAEKKLIGVEDPRILVEKKYFFHLFDFMIKYLGTRKYFDTIF